MAIIAMMMVLVLFTIGRVNTVAYIKGTQGISPIPSAFRIETKLFYANEDYLLESEPRTLSIKDNDIVATVINALKREPERENLSAIVDRETRIISAEIINKKLYLNVSSEIMNGNLWRLGYHDLVIYSIVNSLTQFDVIERVQVKIDSKDISTYVKSDLIISEYAYNEQIVYFPPQSPRELIETFLKYTMIERYDLAYQMTTAYKSLEMNDSGFTQYMRSYRASKLSYSVGKILVDDSKKATTVTVYYEFFDRVRNISFDGGSETWVLVKDEEGYFKVRWKDLETIIP